MYSLRPFVIKLTQIRSNLIKLFWLGQLLLVILVISLIITPALLPYWPRFGRLMANLSVLAFILSVLPGILRRFQVQHALQDLQLILMLFRRQFGISMYLFALYHYLFPRFLITLKLNGNLLGLSPFEISGLVAFCLTTPLFLTSNDQSQLRLGHRWGQLHRLIYLIIWFLVIHITLQLKPGLILVLLVITALAQTISLIKAANTAI